MKVCYLLDFSVFKVDGPTINEYEFITLLENQEDVEVCYFTCVDNKPLITRHMEGSVFFQNLQNERILKLLPYSLPLFLKFIKFYLSVKPDIIVTRLGPIPVLQFFISLFLGKKMFVRTMGRFWKVGPTLNIGDKIYQYMMTFLNVRIMKNVLGLDTVTHKFKDIFVQKFNIQPNKIAVIENAVNPDNFYPVSLKRWEGFNFERLFPILGYVGNLPSTRGARQLLDLYSILKPLYPHMAVLIVGDDPGLSKIKEEVRNHQLENFFFLGEIPYQEVPKVMNCIDIGYSFTTLHDLKEVGNSSQKLRQYLSCGKPVITMQSTNDFVETHDLGSPVDQENIEEIAEETIKWIQRIEKEGDSLAQRLHQYATDHLSTQTTFNQRLKFWNALLKD